MRKLVVLAAVLTAFVVAAAAGPAGAARHGSPSVVKVTALASGLRFDRTTLHARQGKVRIVFTNRSSVSHNVRVESGERELGGTKTIGKGAATAVIVLKKGTYNFYCSVPGHEEAGMRGKLIVT